MSDWSDRKVFTQVLGHQMAHVEEGRGETVLLIHGNPTSSYLWRDVMKGMAGAGRLFAPDLIGLGDSDKLHGSGPSRYTIREHSQYLDAWISSALPDGPVTLVLHDWGGPIGFSWARRHADRVARVAYMETIVRPIALAEWPEQSRDLFAAMRSAAGETMILDKNIFVERILPGSVLRRLTQDEMAEYRRPFAASGEDRRPTLSFPRQIPLDGQPTDVADLVAQNWAWMQASEVPKLLVDADPGAIMKGAILEDARRLSNQTEITVPGIHFIQEDSGAEIGQAIAAWMYA